MNVLIKLDGYETYLAIPATQEVMEALGRAQVVTYRYVAAMGGDAMVTADERAKGVIALQTGPIHPKEYINQLRADAAEESSAVSSEEELEAPL